MYRWDFHRCPGCAQLEHGRDELTELHRSSMKPGVSVDYSGWTVRLYPKGV